MAALQAAQVMLRAVFDHPAVEGLLRDVILVFPVLVHGGMVVSGRCMGATCVPHCNQRTCLCARLSRKATWRWCAVPLTH